MATESLDKKPGITQLDIKRVATWGAGLLLTGAVGFAHGTLWSHESAIAVIKSEQIAASKAQEASDKAREKTLDAMERRFERIETILQEMLKEMRKP
jgi:hypothetical protein